ncbi:MAG: guanylate kinase, partial [Bradymonadaceae bacterium]
KQLRERFGHATTVLVTPPNMQALEARLRNRGTDDEESIHGRLAAARHELGQFELFDFLLENGEFGEALRGLFAIYDASCYRRFRHEAKLKKMLG